MLKPEITCLNFVQNGQPPSGGCVLKQKCNETYQISGKQPPSGGCVLKLFWCFLHLHGLPQPPSGGCVLKLTLTYRENQCDGSRLRAAVC